MQVEHIAGQAKEPFTIRRLQKCARTWKPTGGAGHGCPTSSRHSVQRVQERIGILGDLPVELWAQATAPRKVSFATARVLDPHKAGPGHPRPKREVCKDFSAYADMSASDPRRKVLEDMEAKNSGAIRVHPAHTGDPCRQKLQGMLLATYVSSELAEDWPNLHSRSKPTRKDFTKDLSRFSLQASQQKKSSDHRRFRYIKHYPCVYHGAQDRPSKVSLKPLNVPSVKPRSRATLIIKHFHRYAPLLATIVEERPEDLVADMLTDFSFEFRHEDS